MKSCISCGVELSKGNYTWYKAKNYIHKCNPCSNKEKSAQKKRRMQDPSYRKSVSERSARAMEKLRDADPVLYSCRQMCASAKKRADALGLERDVTPEFLKTKALETCPILGVKIKYGGGERSMDSASIDRINPSKGYTKDNVHVVCLLANLMKSSAQIDEMIRFAGWVNKTYVQSDSIKKPQ